MQRASFASHNSHVCRGVWVTKHNERTAPFFKPGRTRCCLLQAPRKGRCSFYTHTPNTSSDTPVNRDKGSAQDSKEKTFLIESQNQKQPSAIIRSNCSPSTARAATKSCPQVPHPLVFYIPPGMGTPPLPRAAVPGLGSLSREEFYWIPNPNPAPEAGAKSKGGIRTPPVLQCCFSFLWD